MKTGDRFECVVESVAFGGDGVARVDGMVAFVAGALPGEKLVAAITSVKSDYLVAKVSEIKTPSPRRITPACPLFGRCPGCAYMHADYSCELELKTGQLRHLLSAVENAPEPECVSTPSEPCLGYRNKIVLHVEKDHGETILGYMGKSGKVVGVPRCLLADEAINRFLADQLAKPGFFHSLHHNMDVTFRKTPQGVLMWRNSPPRNMSYLKEPMPFGSFSAPVGSFAQVNRTGAAHLVELVGNYVRGTEAKFVVDAYSGSGLFGLTAALAGAETVTLIESDAVASAAAGYNFESRGLRAKFVTADAGEALPEILEAAPPGALLIVDPPRAGLSPRAVGAIARSPIGKVAAISCDPATFARDARKLAQSGFGLKSAKLVNMFPRTAGFELFAILER